MLSMPSTPPPATHTHTYVYLGIFLSSNNSHLCVCNMYVLRGQTFSWTGGEDIAEQTIKHEGLTTSTLLLGNLIPQLDHGFVFDHQAIRGPGSSTLFSRNDKDSEQWDPFSESLYVSRDKEAKKEKQKYGKGPLSSSKQGCQSRIKTSAGPLELLRVFAHAESFAWTTLVLFGLFHLRQCVVSQVVIVVKNQPANAGDIKHEASIPGLRRSPGGGHGNPLQHPCPWTEEPGGLQFHLVTESQTRLKWLSTQHASAPKLT